MDQIEQWARVSLNVVADQEKEKNEKTDKRKTGKERKQATISKRLSAVLLRSFSKQYGESMVCVRRVPGVTGNLAGAD